MLYELLDLAGNRLLKLDPDGSSHFSKLEGKIICIELTGIGQRLYLLPGEDGIRVRGTWTDQPDVLLSGPPAAFARLGLLGARSDSLAARGITIQGDVELSRRFQTLLEGVDLDWEELLSQYVGDFLAHQMGHAAQNVRSWIAGTSATMGANLSEYLQEESRTLASESGVAEFLDAVDVLRADVERLEQRVRRLQSAL